MNRNDLAALYKTNTGQRRNDEEISADFHYGKIQLLEDLPAHKIEEIKKNGSFIIPDEDYINWLESLAVEYLRIINVCRALKI